MLLITITGGATVYTGPCLLADAGSDKPEKTGRINILLGQSGMSFALAWSMPATMKKGRKRAK